MKLAIASAAVLSLVAGSVSACSCSHHAAETKTEAPSCHTHTHEQTALEKNASSFNAECECVTAKPLPAVVAKSDNKTTDTPHDKCIASAQNTVFPETVFASMGSRAIETALINHFANAPGGLLPARAPPRL